MQDYGLQASCSLFLLILLLFSTPFTALQSFLYPQSGQNPFPEEYARFFSHEVRKTRQSGINSDDLLQFCEGDFDIYFIMDKSQAVTKWGEVITSWEDMVEKYVNPKQHMSFILFDTTASTKLPRTPERWKIRQELTKHETIVPQGTANLQKGLEKANEQIENVNSGATKRSSLIIVVIWGDMTPQVLKEAKDEADKARSMGAYIYCVGINSYDKQKLNEIADNDENVFVIDMDNLHLQVDTIGTMTCLELRNVDLPCIGAGNKLLVLEKIPIRNLVGAENQPVTLRGYGFHNAKSLGDVICRFKFPDSTIVDKNPTDKNSTVIFCPSPKLDQPGETISVEVSLNKGREFLAHAIPVTTANCTPPPVPTTPAPGGPAPPLPTPPKNPIPPNAGNIPGALPPVPLPPIPLPPIPLPPLLLPPVSTVPLPQAVVLLIHNSSKEVVLSTVVLLLMLISVLLWWVWWLCCRPPVKARPAPVPQPKPQKKQKPPPPVPSPVPPPPSPPTTTPVNASPIIIICCCTCYDVCVRRGTEGPYTNLDLLADLCSQVPDTKASILPTEEYLSLASCSQCHHLPHTCPKPFALFPPPAQVSPKAPLALPPM